MTAQVEDDFYLNRFENGLYVNGKVRYPKTDYASICRIELLYANRVIDSVSLASGKKKFGFLLKPNLNYTIKIYKKGFAARTIYLNTYMPEGMTALYDFYFDTHLIPLDKLAPCKREVLNYPLALIYFNVSKGNFYYSKKYTRDIKKSLLVVK